MKIEETLKLYEFFGILSWTGVIAFLAVFSIVFLYFSLNIASKIFDSEDKKIKRLVLVAIILLVFGSGIVLKLEANSSKSDLIVANSIKSFFIENKRKYKSLKGLATEMNFGPTVLADTSIKAKMEKIVEVVRNHPDQFLIAAVYENDQNDPGGIEIIDEKAIAVIDSAVSKMLPLYLDKIVHYMVANDEDTLSYSFIQSDIDTRIYQSIMDLVVVNAKGLFIPVNVSDDDFSHAVVLNRKLINAKENAGRYQY
jgi:hypothetical protein